MSKPIDKIKIASELLDRALCMYFEGNSYFSALHLAGAAEEIFGAYVERLGGVSAFKSLQHAAVRISKLIRDRSESTLSNIKAIMNHAKNRTKHMDNTDDDFVYFDPKVEAKDILGRAISNYYQLMSHYELPVTDLIERFNDELVNRSET